MPGRTFAIGDIHGDLQALEALLGKLPSLTPRDTVVFIGDYVDRGPDGKGVIERVRRFVKDSPCPTITLRGNHEDLWLGCVQAPNLGFLLQRGNGAMETFRSFTGGERLRDDQTLEAEEMGRFLDVKGWFPEDVRAWMDALPLWHEDEHALYVHAGLEEDEEGAGKDPGREPRWKHPRDSRPKVLMWMREPEFFKRYKGKRVVFGHTPVSDLPRAPRGLLSRLFHPLGEVWSHGDLLGIDTACGKGGHLSALELPAVRVHESR
ncbi:MAG: serine/threonine protein phosphatase [Deltaproteobacteria bacterium]|nr:serine/threonine protein phosphatase [Deltaproteobacteria bacterium]